MNLAAPFAASSEPELPPALGFLRGGGFATRLILARNWHDHPLGPPGGWPQGLKTALSLILNSPESMILSWGREDLFFFFNETYVPLLGPRVEWAMGAPFDAVWADALDQARPIIDEAFAGDSRRFTDLPWKLATDRGAADTWWTFSYSRVLGATGEVEGLFIFTNETTARVLADRALAATQEELRALNGRLEQQVAERTADRNLLWRLSSDIMLVARGDGAMEAVNPAWTRMLGWAETELVGRPVFDLVHPDDLPATLDAAAAIGRGEALARFENRYRHKDGSYRDIVWAAAPGDGKIVGVGRDATEEKARAAQLALAEEQLRQSQKMEAVGQLTGGIAHDFNNMLTGVIGSLDLLKRRLGETLDARAERYIDAATISAQRAAGLTQRLLAFSRRQPLDVRATDVNALAIGMEDLLRRTVGENIVLQLMLHAVTWPALTDANQLESALLNLAINARDAMADGGRLTVTTGNLRLDTDAAAARHRLPPGDYVALGISDTGTGMPAEVAARAFDPFFTTKPVGSGTGLGLSMIYGFVRQTGGRVRIDTAEGGGTTVELLLPRARAAAVAAERAPVVRLAARPGESVLLVEDDPAVRMLVADVLDDLGYRVSQAADGREALAMLPELGRIDLLISDIGLPGINGRDLADAVRERRHGLKVLFVSGYAEQATTLGAFLGEGMALISKPFDIDALSGQIRAMLDRPALDPPPASR